MTATNTSFNQDATSLVICQAEKLEIFSISNNCLEVDKIHSDSSLKDVIISERLFGSSLLIAVCRLEPRTLRVYHFRKGTEICAYSYGSNILNVKLNRMRLIVVCEKAIYFHDTKDMQLLHEIKNINFNPKGICCLSKSEASGHPLLAYSGSTRDGLLHIYECDSFRMASTVSAHKTPIVALAIYDCNYLINSNIYKVPNTRALLATASDTGTVVRIWAVRTAGNVEKLADLRRGTMRSAKVSSLNFSDDGKWLALISDTETVHIWKIEQLLDPITPRHSIGYNPQEELITNSNTKISMKNDDTTSSLISNGSWFSASSWSDYGKDLAKSVLPDSIGSAVSAGRANITATLPSSGYRSKVAIFSEEGMDYVQILVTMIDGSLLIYEADIAGGEAMYVRRHLLIGVSDEENENVSNDVEE